MSLIVSFACFISISMQLRDYHGILYYMVWLKETGVEVTIRLTCSVPVRKSIQKVTKSFINNLILLQK